MIGFKQVSVAAMKLGAKDKDDNSPYKFDKILRLFNGIIYKHKTEKLLFSSKELNSRELASLLDKSSSFTF